MYKVKFVKEETKMKEREDWLSNTSRNELQSLIQENEALMSL